MTTSAEALLYEAQHVVDMQHKRPAVYNPENKPLAELPFILGFNNGGSSGWFSARLIAEDGTELGGHTCSSEAYMLHDLGVLEGTRLDRHETFKAHYPHGYRMTFISYQDIPKSELLLHAFELNKAKRKG